MKKYFIKTVILFFFCANLTSLIAMSGGKVYNILELTELSTIITRVKVSSIHSYKKENGYIYSDIKFNVVNIYKGHIDTSEIELTILVDKLMI